jgi:hypothetical protein
MWPPELETLDQLSGDAMPLKMIRGLYESDEQFQRAMLAMLESQELCIKGNDGNQLPKWKWQSALRFDDELGDLKASILDAGAKRIG